MMMTYVPLEHGKSIRPRDTHNNEQGRNNEHLFSRVLDSVVWWGGYQDRESCADRI